jgi:ATP-binding protein involved in chromosome partitioning
MALDDTRKGVNMFRKHNTPVVGIVENMSSFVCPSCGDDHNLFGATGVDDLADEYDVPLLERIPLHPDFGTEGGNASVAKDQDSQVYEEVNNLVTTVADRIGEINRRQVADHAADADVEMPPAEADT